jgi:hypothetical protein
MKPLLIGLAGKAEHGKSAVSRIIKEWTEQQNGGNAFICELSQFILKECWENGTIPSGQQRDPLNKEQNAALIAHGTNRRKEDPLYWTKLTIKAMLESGANIAVCPNLRFPQEAQAIRDAGGVVIRVNRLNADGTNYVSVTRDPNDPTETALDFWPSDFYLYNITGHGKLLENLTFTLIEYIVDTHD